MNKKISLGLSLALLLVVACLSVTLTMVFAMERFSTTVNDVNKRQAQFDYIGEIDKMVRQNHTGTIRESELREALARSYMQNIGDPYADYIPADDYAVLLKTQNGKAEGFGLTLTRNAAGEVTVVTVDENSPAGLAGVQVGDAVVSIDDIKGNTPENYTLMNEELEAVNKLVVTVMRGETELSFSLARNEYDLVTVTGKMLGEIAYVRVRSFNATTAEQFYAVYEKLMEQGAKAVVLDVRGNRGGSVQAACDVVSYLMPRGTFATRTNADGSVEELSTDGSAYELDLPTTVLINGATAGEAELLAGVLHAFSKASTLGTTTSGRACVQEYFNISSDNAAIKLSVAELGLTQSGSWEGTGIVPDVEQALYVPEQNLEFLPLEQDTQLTAAVTLLTEQITKPSELPPETTTPSDATQTTAATAATTAPAG